MGGVSELALAVEHLERHRRVSDDCVELTLLLYESWYARPHGSVDVPELFPDDLVQVFRAADETARVWEDGWAAERVGAAGSVIARRGGEVRMADRCDYVAPGAIGVLPQPGDALVLAGRRDRVDPDGTWWRTGGRSWRFTHTHPGLVRLYLSFDFEYLPEVVARLTGAFGDVDWPWMLKCSVDPDTHARPDATVLYISLDGVEALAAEIDAVAAALAPHARSCAPPLTLPIHPGVAVAFDPPEGQSFGEHRCRLIVEALGSASISGDETGLSGVQARMADAGVRPDRPWAFEDDPLLPWER